MKTEDSTKPLKVGIFTTFYNFRPEYSLCGVVLQQLVALQKYGYQPILFVLENFSGDENVPEGVEIRKVIPQLILEPYGAQNTDNLDSDVAKTVPALNEHFKDIDVCLTHDIIFINSYLPYNVALRKAIDQELGHVKWLHWMHSAPSFKDLSGTVWDNLVTLPKNSRLIYMNNTDVLRAAEMYHVHPKDVRVVYNPMDMRILHNFHPLTNEIINAYDLMNPEFICVYPLSTTRMDQNGKQLSKVIKVIAELKKQGRTVALVVPNAHANADREKEEIQRMYQLAFDKGLEARELIFTSLFDTPNNEHGVPHEVVRDFFLLGNLFIFPSVSENCPLVLLEAMASANILVLNESFPAMREFGREDAMYFGFGSLLERDRDFPHGEDKYYRDIAVLIVSEMTQNKAVKAQTRLRQIFNVDAVAKRQLIPAIQEIYAEQIN